MSYFHRKKNELFRNESGGATVEFVLWLPVFMLIVALIIDATLLLQTQSRFFDVARSASRQVALGILTEQQAEEFVARTFRNDSAFSVTVGPDESGELVTTTISVPFSKVMIVSGKFAAFGDGQLSASISMVKEANSSES